MPSRPGPRQAILKLLADGQPRQTQWIANALGMDPKVVQQSVYNMRRDGVLESSGSRQTAMFRLVGSKTPPPSQVKLPIRPRQWFDVGLDEREDRR